MAYLHVQTPGAKPMNEAADAAFAALGCEPLGGPSQDGWSKLSDLQRCAYRYYLRHELGAVPQDARPSPALEIGGLYHAALALYYCRMLPEGYPGWRKNPPPPLDFLDEVARHGAELSHVQEARRLYSGYVEHYAADDIQPVAVEYSAGKPGVHTCRYDLLAWREGALWVVEHKSAFRLTPDVLEGWWLDGEILGQLYGWRISRLGEVFGAEPAGVLINLISKGHPPEFRRIEVVVPEKVVEAYVADRQYWTAQRERFRRGGRWPRSLAGCLGRYDMCSYWAHCRDEDASLLHIRSPEAVTAVTAERSR